MCNLSAEDTNTEESQVRAKQKKLTVLDLFCGAGGFSEGFKQQGCEIVQGVDCWEPAINTFNHNFRLTSQAGDVLDISKNIKGIATLPDTDILIGSPPCVNFSSSNKCGNADKASGISLIEAFIKIVAVKKYQPNSSLKAWFMENVLNARKYIKDEYTFADLRLTKWAKKHKLHPDEVAISLKNNMQIVNATDFGVAQSRKRIFAGEVVKLKSFPKLQIRKLKQPISVNKIFRDFPKPFKKQNIIKDPNYKFIHLDQEDLTDHFYDTGIYESHWGYAKHHKTNHPYMGNMFFPENKDNPSRTVTATALQAAREALIYDCELDRTGDGQYRSPTIREISVLMSFPITYQFFGSQNTKWCLIGNAVTPLVSGAIAKATLQALHINIRSKPFVEKIPNLYGINNLNNFQKKSFNNPPKRKKGCRFRRHPFKEGNMTVALSNYCLKKNGTYDGKWRTTVTYGSGKNYKLQAVDNRRRLTIKNFIERNFNDGAEFIQKVDSEFLSKVASRNGLQSRYEQNISDNKKLSPIDLIDETAELISQYANGEIINTNKIFKHKSNVHKRQLYALYAITQISKTANSRK